MGGQQALIVSSTGAVYDQYRGTFSGQGIFNRTAGGFDDPASAHYTHMRRPQFVPVALVSAHCDHPGC